MAIHLEGIFFLKSSQSGLKAYEYHSISPYITFFDNIDQGEIPHGSHRTRPTDYYQYYNW